MSKTLKIKIVNYNKKRLILASPIKLQSTLPLKLTKDINITVTIGKQFNFNTIPTLTKSLNTYPNKTVINENIKGKIIQKVKGGFKVKANNQFCFLPNSQLSKTRNIINKYKNFKIITKTNKEGNIILSRKKYLEDKKQLLAQRLLKNPKLTLRVKIKNITKYGVFATYKNIDGLIKIKKPLLKKYNICKGKTVKAKLYKWDKETNRLTYQFYKSKNTLKKLLSNLERQQVFLMYLLRKTPLSKVVNKTTIGVIKTTNINWVTHSTNRAVLVKCIKTTHPEYGHTSLIRNPWNTFNYYYTHTLTIKSINAYIYNNIYICKLPFRIFGFCKQLKTPLTIRQLKLHKKKILLG
ncbi:hypothetical protein JS520_00575 [Candidatus Vidania fulgoroideae]|nr:hypothetical protein JS520_00575 [Candidatus Vidania fulgoroideae]